MQKGTDFFVGRPQCVGEFFDDLFASQLRFFGVCDFPPKKVRRKYSC